MAEEFVLDIKNLAVHYETEDADVHAVNGIDIVKLRRITVRKASLYRIGNRFPHQSCVLQIVSNSL